MRPIDVPDDWIAIEGTTLTAPDGTQQTVTMWMPPSLMTEMNQLADIAANADGILKAAEVRARAERG